MTEISSLDFLKDKKIGEIKDSTISGTPQENGNEDAPAVKVAKESDIFTSNKLYGNTATPDDLNRLGSGASLFTATQTNPINTNNSTERTEGNSNTTINGNGEQANVQKTALPSALTGVTDKGNVEKQNDSTNILKNLYAEYNRLRQNA